MSEYSNCLVEYILMEMEEYSNCLVEYIMMEMLENTLS